MASRRSMSATVAAVLLAATGAQAQDSVSNCNVPDGGSFVSALTVTVNGQQQTIRLGERGLTRDIMFNPDRARQYVAEQFGLTEELQYTSCSGEALIHTSDLPPPPPPPAMPVQPVGPVFFNGFGAVMGSADGWRWSLCGSPANHGLTSNPVEASLVFKYFVPGLGLTNDELAPDLLAQVRQPTRDNAPNFIFNSDGTQYRPPMQTTMQVSGVLPEEVEGLDVVPDAPVGGMADAAALPPEPELETDEAPPADMPATGDTAQDIPAGDVPDTGTQAQDTSAGDAPATDSPAADTPSGDSVSDGASG